MSAAVAVRLKLAAARAASSMGLVFIGCRKGPKKNGSSSQKTFSSASP